MNKRELKDALVFARKMAIDAGDILKVQQRKIDLLKISYKDAQGVASSADLLSEKFIIKKIKESYCHHHILAEEQAFESKGLAKNNYREFKNYDWCWIVDPLDGTNNFLNGSDYFAVSIALAHRGIPILGVVYRPITGDCFYTCSDFVPSKFIRYLGLNSEKMRAKSLYKEINNKKLSDAILVTGFATEKGRVVDIEFDNFKRMLTKVRAIRRFGSAALDLCYVAAGVWDGFWEMRLSPWDTAAAGLICLNSGVMVTDFKGCEFSPFDSTICAARNSIYNQIIVNFN